jgi:hypothetical protein
MYDGTIKMVQNITVGDKLMGDDSTPRTVLSLAQGKDDMYDIIPVKGDKYTVNSEHILCLKPTRLGVKTIKSQTIKPYSANYINIKDGKIKAQSFKTKEEANAFLNNIHTPANILEIPVKDYLKLSKSSTNNLKGYRVGVDFSTQEVIFDPYIIGLWLGDGSQRDPVITSQDARVLHYLTTKLKDYDLSLNYQSQYDYRISSYTGQPGDNVMLEALRKYNLLNNKHIPNDYKINSKEIRLQVLAGLIDSDGSADNKGYEITQTNKVLANDIVFLARSLGFAANMKECEKSCMYKGVKKTGKYQRIYISGNELYKVPVKILRKQLEPRTQIKDTSITGIRVKHVGVDKYYGFTLDGNNRYLLGDFTVTHNTCSAIATASSSFEQNGYSIIYVTRHTLKADVWKNMFDQVCSTIIQDYLKSGKTLPSAHAARLRLISKKWFEPLSYRQFSNMLEGKNQMYEKLIEFNGKKDPLHKTLVIIDEAHKLFAADVEGPEKANIEVIRNAIQNSYHTSGKDSVKMLLMTATPYTSEPMDMIRLMNLLRPSEISIPEDFEDFSKAYLDENGLFSTEGTRKFVTDINGYISYLNRERDIRSFAYPIIHNITVPMSDYEFKQSLNDFQKLEITYRGEKHSLDFNKSYAHTQGADMRIQLQNKLNLDLNEYERNYKKCSKHLEKDKQTENKENLIKFIEQKKICENLLTECYKNAKDTYFSTVETLKETAKDDLKTFKIDLKQQKLSKDTQTKQLDIQKLKIKNDLKDIIEQLKSDFKFDIEDCRTTQEYIDCNANAIQDNKEAIKNINEKYKIKTNECNDINTDAKEYKSRKTTENDVHVKEFIETELEKFKVDEERVKKLNEQYTKSSSDLNIQIKNDKSQRTGLEKCLSTKMQPAVKEMLRNEGNISLNDSDINKISNTLEQNGAMDNIYLISGHGSEIVKPFKSRYIMPADKVLVVFPVCSRPLFMNTGCKFVDVFLNKRFKALLRNPIKYRAQLNREMGQNIRIFLPGERVPELSTNLFFNFEISGDVVLAKSGVFRLNQFPELDRTILPATTNPNLQLGSSLCVRASGVVKNINEYTGEVHKQVFKGNVYKPASSGTSYNNLNNRSFKLQNIMNDVGTGIYYYIGCRSSSDQLNDRDYINILENSEGQQDYNQDSREKRFEELAKKIKVIKDGDSSSSSLDIEFEKYVPPKKATSSDSSSSSSSLSLSEKQRREVLRKKLEEKQKKKQEKSPVKKLEKNEKELFTKISQDIEKYNEKLFNSNRTVTFKWDDQHIKWRKDLKEMTQSAAVLRTLKLLDIIEHIIENIPNKTTKDTVLKVNMSQTHYILNQYTQYVIKKTKYYYHPKIYGIIPFGLKYKDFKCTSKLLVERIEKLYKKGEIIDLPKTLEEWNTEEFYKLCRSTRIIK